MDFGLQGKQAFVGGASRGIGKAIALELAREGADVVVASRSMPDLERAAAEIAEVTGRRIVPMSFDATQRDQVDRVINEAAQALGGLQILVNSASLPGGSPSATGPIEGLVDEDLISDFDVKFMGAVRAGGDSLAQRAGLRSHRQHQRAQRPQRRQPVRRRAQCVHGTHDQDAGLPAGTVRHYR